MLLDFLKQKCECSHKHVSPAVDEAYCPDCGALVRNKWYIVRCSCCNIKRVSHLELDKIVPDSKFCHNCGSENYCIQEIDNINFTDINYAILRKETVEQNINTTSQVWIENEEKFLTEKKLIECKE